MLDRFRNAIWSTPRRRLAVLVALVGIGATVASWALCLSSFGPLCRMTPAELLQSAEQRLARDDVTGAQIDLRNLLKENPESGPGRLLFAKTLLRTGETAGALQELDTAGRRGVADEDRWVTQAAALLAQGQLERVVTLFADKRPESDGNAAELLTLVARAHFALGHPADARTALEAALARKPDFLAAQVLQARILAVGGDVNAARGRVDSLLKSAPQDAEAWLLLGDLLSTSTASAAEATAAYKKAVGFGPRLAEAHGGLIMSLLRSADPAAAVQAADAMRKALPASPLATYFQGLTAYLNGDLVTARDRLQSLTLDNNPQLLVLAGTVASKLGNLAQAETLLLRALQAKPGDARARGELASLYIRRGQPERALSMVEPLLAAAPPDADSWRLAGQAHVRMGNFALADKAFQQVRKIRPADKAIGLDVGRLLISRGQFDAGLRELETAASADAKGVAAELELVAAHMSRKDVAAALGVARSMAAKLPDAAAPLLVQGRIQAQAGQRAEARTAFEAALAKEPNSFVVVQSLAELDMADSKPDLARGRYTDYLKRDPQSAAAMLALADLTRRAGGSRAQAAEWVDKAVQVNALDASIWHAAVEFHRDGADTVSALARARSANAALPDNTELLALLAQAQLAEGDLQQSISNFSRLVDLRPTAADAHLRLSEALLAAQRNDRALAAAEKAMELAPDWMPATRTAARAALAAQRPANALAMARAWQARRPQLAFGWHLEGEIQMSIGQLDAGIAALRTAFAKGNSSDLAWSLYAALRRAGRVADATQVSQSWLKAHPDDAGFENRLGEEALGRGDLAAAEAHYRQALTLVPSSPMYMNNLAYALVRRNDPRALELAMKAFDMAPYSPPILDTVAHAFAAQGRLAKAAEVEALAIELAPKTTSYVLALARFYIDGGEKAKARDVLEKLQADLGPEAARKDPLRELLRKARE